MCEGEGVVLKNVFISDQNDRRSIIYLVTFNFESSKFAN